MRTCGALEHVSRSVVLWPTRAGTLSSRCLSAGGTKMTAARCTTSLALTKCCRSRSPRRACRPGLRAGPHHAAVVELGAVEHVEAGAARACVRAHLEFAHKGARLCIAAGAVIKERIVQGAEVCVPSAHRRPLRHAASRYASCAWKRGGGGARGPHLQRQARSAPPQAMVSPTWCWDSETPSERERASERESGEGLARTVSAPAVCVCVCVSVCACVSAYGSFCVPHGSLCLSPCCACACVPVLRRLLSHSASPRCVADSRH